MAIFNVNLGEVEEAQAVPSGMYELQITAAEEQETGPNSKRPGSPMLKFTLGFTDLSLNAPQISHYMTLPYDGDENANFKLLMAKRFLVAFKIPFNEEFLDSEKICTDALGCSATVQIDLTEPDENGNVYNRLRVPRIPKETRSGPPRH